MDTGSMIKYASSKLLHELIGTAIFTLFFVQAAGAPSTLLACLWILTVFLWKISGSHFNPAISFAYMFRKDEKKISAKLSICYIVI